MTDFRYSFWFPNQKTWKYLQKTDFWQNMRSFDKNEENLTIVLNFIYLIGKVLHQGLRFRRRSPPTVETLPCGQRKLDHILERNSHMILKIQLKMKYRLNITKLGVKNQISNEVDKIYDRKTWKINWHHENLGKLMCFRLKGKNSDQNAEA